MSMFGSYKFKVLIIILVVALVPVIGMFVLAGLHVATVEQAVEMTKWALGASSLTGIVTIAGRAAEDAASKGAPTTNTAGGDITNVAAATVVPPAEMPTRPALPALIEKDTPVPSTRPERS